MVAEGDPLVEEGFPVCTECGGKLSFLTYSYPFTFGCVQGHFMTLQALLDVLLTRAPASELSALDCWDRKAVLLRQLAQRALEVGHVFTAADLQEVALRIDHWVTTLRSLRPLTESEALRAD
ncbi:MAG TPA: hypothetical protein VKW04_14880 [Planctomycetota bacterium]|nr:hypothetical protein [Planctomycetota bacterium]